AQAAHYQNETLNIAAEAAIEDWQQHLKEVEKKKAKLKAGGFSLPHSLLLLVFLALLFGVGVKGQGIAFVSFIKGFALVFLIALIALLLAAQNDFKDYGIEYALWAILLGIVISNTIGT